MDPTSSAALRQACRSGTHTGHTSGFAPGHLQCNVVVLPKEYADEFLLFCVRNPKPCPVIDVLDAGKWESHRLAPGSDIRTDLPRYRVFREGKLVDEPTDITSLWQSDFVTFFLGCSFSFEHALASAGIPIGHNKDGRNVPMYTTNIETRAAGRFSGPLVVSMRSIPFTKLSETLEITRGMIKAHGAPVYTGEAAAIGIPDLANPSYGDPPVLPAPEGTVSCFWACGVTPQEAILRAKPPIAITHAPGCMFVADIEAESADKLDGYSLA